MELMEDGGFPPIVAHTPKEEFTSNTMRDGGWTNTLAGADGSSPAGDPREDDNGVSGENSIEGSLQGPTRRKMTNSSDSDDSAVRMPRECKEITKKNTILRGPRKQDIKGRLPVVRPPTPRRVLSAPRKETSSTEWSSDKTGRNRRYRSSNKRDHRLENNRYEMFHAARI